MRLAPVPAALLASSLLASVAAADEIAAPEPTPPTFSTLSTDGSHGSEVGFDLIVIVPRGEDANEDALFNLRVGGTYLDRRSGVGGYGSISMTTGDQDTGIGNLEVGGLVRREVSPEVAVAARVGLALGTSDSADEFGGAFVNYFATLFTRPAEVAQALPGLTSLRAAVTPTWHKGKAFLRGEMGADVVVDGDYEEIGPLGHLGLAAGFASGGFAGTVEYQGLRWVDNRDTTIFHAFAVSAQHGTDKFAIYAGLAIPVSDAFDGSEDVLDLFIGAKARL